MIEVLKQMVDALEWCHGGEPVGTADAIQAGKKLIAELESQEPVAWADHGVLNWIADMQFKHASYLYPHPPQLEQNFCSRCGKRTNDIHTCTPPRE